MRDLVVVLSLIFGGVIGVAIVMFALSIEDRFYIYSDDKQFEEGVKKDEDSSSSRSE